MARLAFGSMSALRRAFVFACPGETTNTLLLRRCMSDTNKCTHGWVSIQLLFYSRHGKVYSVAQHAGPRLPPRTDSSKETRECARYTRGQCHRSVHGSPSLTAGIRGVPASTSCCIVIIPPIQTAWTLTSDSQIIRATMSNMQAVDMNRLKQGEVNLGVRLDRIGMAERLYQTDVVHLSRLPSWQLPTREAW